MITYNWLVILILIYQIQTRGSSNHLPELLDVFNYKKLLRNELSLCLKKGESWRSNVPIQNIH